MLVFAGGLVLVINFMLAPHSFGLNLRILASSICPRLASRQVLSMRSLQATDKRVRLANPVPFRVPQSGILPSSKFSAIWLAANCQRLDKD